MTEAIITDGGERGGTDESDEESERDERGRFRPRFTDEEMLAFIRDAPAPAQTARSVADHFDVERPAVHERLNELLDEGRVERAKLTPRVVIWWVGDGESADQESGDGDEK